MPPLGYYDQVIAARHIYHSVHERERQIANIEASQEFSHALVLANDVKTMPVFCAPRVDLDVPRAPFGQQFGQLIVELVDIVNPPIDALVVVHRDRQWKRSEATLHFRSWNQVEAELPGCHATDR